MKLKNSIDSGSGGGTGGGPGSCPPCGQAQAVPEPHSALSLFALGTLGASSTFLRNKKNSC